MILLVGFLLGILVVVAVEALALIIFIYRVTRKVEASGQSDSKAGTGEPRVQHLVDYDCSRQGVVWILESDTVSGDKRTRGIIEVSPVMKFAAIREHSLFLSDPDGSPQSIPLAGCNIVAVSGSQLSSRKWANRYPVKITSKSSSMYTDSKTIYMYLETSWEKESWCKALRIAASDDIEVQWFMKLKEEFHHYLRSLNSVNPFFLKSSTPVEPEARASRTDVSASKVRQIFKRLAKKTSRTEDRNGGNFLPDRRNGQVIDRPGLWKNTFSTVCVSSSTADKNSPGGGFPLSISCSDTGLQNRGFGISERRDDKFCIDEGTLCFNLLISRLFFDIKQRADIMSAIQARIQRMLSNMRIPSYMGDIICTAIDIGVVPPHILNMRVLPGDMNDVWAFEVDIDYSGGASLNVETRLELHDMEFPENIVETYLDPSHATEVTSDIIDGFEHLGQQLKYSENKKDEVARTEEFDYHKDRIMSSKLASSTSSNMSRWKSVLHSLVKQVSQVALSISVKVSSLQGTVRVQLKPPPSDHVWFAFTTMPDINLSLDSSIGGCSVTNGRVAFFIANRLKAAIRDALVLPNSESLWIPLMIGEKDNWIPRTAAPFMRGSSGLPGGGTAKSRSSRGIKTRQSKNSQAASPGENVEERGDIPITKSLSESSSTLSTQSTHSLRIDGSEMSSDRGSSLDEASFRTEEDDDGGKQKRGGRRARMLHLVGEKFEEKRRHIEEKGKHIVEKIRGASS